MILTIWFVVYIGGFLTLGFGLGAWLGVVICIWLLLNYLFVWGCLRFNLLYCLRDCVWFTIVGGFAAFWRFCFILRACV